MVIDVIKIFLPLTVSFFLGIALTPILTHYLYKKEMWKKQAKTVAIDGRGTPIFNQLHKDKEVGTPKMGGVVIWLSATLTMLFIWLAAKFFPGDLTHKLDFMSRDQTWLPLMALLVGAFVGLIDDYMDISGIKSWKAGGLSLKKRLAVVAAVGLFAALWFYIKLDVTSVTLPFFSGDVEIGWLFVPFFVFVTLALYSGGIIDGLDGLAGGIFSIIFSAYAGIAFYQHQLNLAAFCAVIVGGLLAFLWFNIPPARFYMSETGSMALTLALAIVAFMTDSLGEGRGIAVLPIIALPLILTTLSIIVQLVSKKFRNGKKIFLVAPIHHHFEALGWPAYKVTMRYWIIGFICAVIGLTAAMIGKF
jgi:phospho-N-acetylmuramoyl-pentapeptide-transferase